MPLLRDPLPLALSNDAHAELLAPWLPRLARWREEFRARLGTLRAPENGLALDIGALEESACERLARHWLWMCTPTLVRELDIARRLGELSGESAEARYRWFTDSLTDPSVAAARLSDYPMLAEQVEDRARQALNSSVEALERLFDDGVLLRSVFFSGRNLGPLTELETRAGDPHSDGRSVAMLGFAGGERVVYKPRSLAVDAHFQQLLGWLNQRGAPQVFRAVQILDRGEYGWMEFVAPAPCTDQPGLSRYHERLGALLAVLHATRAVDVHLENLIAAGEQPVVVDLETLFHPTPPSITSRPEAVRVVLDALDESVLRVGLLPYRPNGVPGEHADLSGVAPAQGQMAPDAAIQWENVGRDDMHAVRKTLPLPPSHHRPTLSSVEADVTEFAPEMTRGFTRMAELLRGHRQDLFAPDGPIAAFASDRVRVILRPTRVYGLLLDASWHPDALVARETRRRFFERLAIAGDAPELEAAMPFECRDLESGDVPSFWTRAGRHELWSSRGERVACRFAETPLEASRRVLEALDDREIARQAWLLNASLAMEALNRDRGHWIEYPTALPEAPPALEALRERLLDEARAIGGWFERMAVGDAERATWVVLDFRGMSWSVNAAATDLYSGTPGIVLFLAHLGAIAGDPEITLLARRGLRSFLERLDQPDGPPVERGLFQGLGGAIYLLAHLAGLWREPEWLQAAESRLAPLSAMIERDQELDVVAGSAGVLLALLALERAGGSPRVLELAARCADRLLSRARQVSSGLIWTNALSGDDPAIGFAHGASGIAFALLRFAGRTGDLAARRGALAALRAERVPLTPMIERWRSGSSERQPATRSGHAERTLSMSWCHGLAGLALGRLEAGPVDSQLASDRDEWLSILAEHGFGRSHCLCHGDLGSMDVLERALSRSGEARSGLPNSTLLLRRTAGVLDSIAEGGWRCGTMSEVEAPGLMNGLAGIGYGLLRLREPDRVPSILALDPPREYGWA